MQFNSDFTKEQLKQDSDPLSYACHPFSKLRMAATFIAQNTYKTKDLPFEGYNSEEVYPISEIIDDSVSDISNLIAVADELYLDLENKNKALKAKIQILEKQLGSIRPIEIMDDNVVPMEARRVE